MPLQNGWTPNAQGANGSNTPAAGQGSNTGNLPDNVVQSFEKFIEKHGGDSKTAALVLFSENKEFRDEIRTLKGKVLAGDEAVELQRYRDLGKPSELEAAKQERDEYKGKIAERERSDYLEKIAVAAGYKASVLKEIAGDQEYVEKDEKVAGQLVKKVYVKDGDKEVFVDDWMKANKADFMPSLQAEQPLPVAGNGRRPPPSGVTVKKQEVTPIFDVKRAF